MSDDFEDPWEGVDLEDLPITLFVYQRWRKFTKKKLYK